MKRKEVEDVMGGKEAWGNVDKTDGMSTFFRLMLCGGRGCVERDRGRGLIVGGCEDEDEFWFSMDMG